MTSSPQFSPPDGAALSDDGNYWWDGSQWQPVNPPPPAQYGQGDAGAPDGVDIPPDTFGFHASGVVDVAEVAHTLHTIAEPTPAGIAIHVAGLESDNPALVEAQQEQEFQDQLDEQTADARYAQMNESLPHVIPMDAPAVREQEAIPEQAEGNPEDADGEFSPSQ